MANLILAGKFISALNPKNYCSSRLKVDGSWFMVDGLSRQHSDYGTAYS
jgi:hypothetical protein